MKKTFPLLLLLALSNNYIAQNADNVLNDTLIKQHTIVSSQHSNFNHEALSGAIGIKYIGFVATALGATILINNNTNSINNDEESKRALGGILTICGGLLSFLGVIGQDIEILNLGRDHSHSKKSNTSIETRNQVINTENIHDEFDGRIFHDRKHFSLFKMIKISEDNAEAPSVLISYWYDGKRVEIWINPNSKNLVWDKK